MPIEDGDRVEELVEAILPAIVDLLSRIDPEAGEFTTPEFIEVMREDPASRTAYDDAVRGWGEGDHRSKMVVHGQVIPMAMRRSGLVEWLGFAHGASDPYAIPARWQLRSPDEGPDTARGTQRGG